MHCTVQGLAQLRDRGEEADTRALMEVQEELVAGGYMKPAADAALAGKGAAKGRKAAKKGGGSGQGAAGFRRYTSPGGLDVLIGRTSKQNDELSIKVAQADDIWMHVRGMPGSHTVLRVPSGKSVTDEDLEFAADLAAFFSKAKLENKADVIVAKASNVKKTKGAKPGAVMVTREMRNVVARPGNSIAAKQGVVD